MSAASSEAWPGIVEQLYADEQAEREPTTSPLCDGCGGTRPMGAGAAQQRLTQHDIPKKAGGAGRRPSQTSALLNERNRPMTTTAITTDAPTVHLTIERFAHGTDPDRHPGDRGTCVETRTRFTSGRVFSTYFPTVFVADNGEVSISAGDFCAPGPDVLAWLRAITAHLESRLDAS